MSEHPRCKANVMERGRGFSHWQCSAKAVTEAGYCRMHDPAEKAKRAAAKPPTKYVRQQAIKAAVRRLVSQRFTAEETTELLNAVWMGWGNPWGIGWPITLFGEQIPLPEGSNE